MTAHPADPSSATEPGVSRRGVVTTAAKAGAAGLAAGLVLKGAAGTPAVAATPEHSAEPAPGEAHEPVVVHVRDTRTGELDAFHGQTHRRVYDRELAAAIMRVAR